MNNSLHWHYLTLGCCCHCCCSRWNTYQDNTCLIGPRGHCDAKAEKATCHVGAMKILSEKQTCSRDNNNRIKHVKIITGFLCPKEPDSPPACLPSSSPKTVHNRLWIRVTVTCREVTLGGRQLQKRTPKKTKLFQKTFSVVLFLRKQKVYRNKNHMKV